MCSTNLFRGAEVFDQKLAHCRVPLLVSFRPYEGEEVAAGFEEVAEMLDKSGEMSGWVDG